MGGTDGPDASQQIPSITIALDTSLESADGLFEDPFLEKLRSSSKISIETYPVDSDSAKIEALRFGHVDLAVVDGASAWMGWMQHGLEVMAAEVDYQGRSYHNAHAWVRSSDPIAVAHLDGELATDPFELFEGRKPCFTGWPDSVGALLPMGFLLGLGYANVMGDPNDIDSLLLTIQGFFQSSSNIPQPGTTYYGEEGSLRCLSESQGDIAFLSDDTVQRFCSDEDSFRASWCLETNEYVMLPTFGRSPSDAVLFNPDFMGDDKRGMLSSILVAPSDDIGGAPPSLGGGLAPQYASSSSLEHMNGYSSLVYNVPGMQSYFSENESESDLDIDEVRIGFLADGLSADQSASMGYFAESLGERLGVNVSIVYLQDRDELVGSLNSGDLELGYLDGYGSWRAWRSGALSILATFESHEGGRSLGVHPIVLNGSDAAGAQLESDSITGTFEYLRGMTLCRTHDADVGIDATLASYLLSEGFVRPEDFPQKSSLTNILGSFFNLANTSSNSSETESDHIDQCLHAGGGDVVFTRSSHPGLDCDSHPPEGCLTDPEFLALPSIAAYPTPSLMYQPSDLSVVTRTTILNSILSLNGEMYLENFTSLGRTYTGCYDISVHKVDAESPRAACGSEILDKLFDSNGASRTTTQAHLRDLDETMSVLPSDLALP